MSFWEKKVFDVFEAFLEAHENIPISFWENCDESADWGRADPGVPVKVKREFKVLIQFPFSLTNGFSEYLHIRKDKKY